MRVLAISGSLRRDSYNAKLLRAAEELVSANVRFERYDGLESVPPYNEDRDTQGAPPAVARLREAIAGADALLIATPEYNASVPGQLKNAIDWASRPVRAGALWGKPVAVIGASTGMYGGVWAQAELRKILGTAGARVVDAEVGSAVPTNGSTRMGGLPTTRFVTNCARRQTRSSSRRARSSSPPKERGRPKAASVRLPAL